MYEKQEFTRNYLAPLLRRLNENIYDVIYKVDKKTNEEYVIISYRWDDEMGNYQGISKKICVTADSLSAMTTDVLNKGV